MVLCAGLSACGRHSRDVPDGQRCTEDGDRRWCAYETEVMHPGVLATRKVHFQTPVGTPPPEGWPVALLFQGSFNPASKFWEGTRNGPWGVWWQVGTVEALLDAGFAVVTPDAQGGGNTYWNSNVVPWNVSWSGSPDDKLMGALFEAMDDGTFGPLDPDRRVAAGISSGGYMTSRMALSYPGEFRALAVVSASWATCAGSLCTVPDELPSDHPPTLFLHGEKDDVVPLASMEKYADALEAGGHEVRVVTDAEVGHAWIPAAPEEVVEWFTEHTR
ncbi:MAG: prolyl oligopeptidase family serine peptidase [Myxococcota bacterium]